LILTALLLLASAVCYGIGFYAVGEVPGPVVWATIFTLLWYGISAGMLLTGRQAWWGAQVVGLLAWEWLGPPLLAHSEVRANAPHTAWLLLVLANASGIAAQLVASIAVLRGVRASSRRRLAVAVIAAFAIPLTVISANVFIAAHNIDNTNEGTAPRLVLAVLCAAVPALVLFGAPVPALWWGWLIGGALFALDNTVLLHYNRSDYPLTGPIAQWVLLAALLVVVLVAARLTAPAGRPAEPRRS
jgi:hypothetical protein